MTLYIYISRVLKQQTHLRLTHNTSQLPITSQLKTIADYFPTSDHSRRVNMEWDSISTAGVRDRDLERLVAEKKLHLVLDLDHTLVHCAKGSKLTVHDKEVFNNSSSHERDSYMLYNGALMLKLRPGVRSFLEKACKMFDISIYTMGSFEYAKRVVKVLDPEDLGFFGDPNRTIYSRENCTVEKQKGLDIVLSHPRVTLIVDDKPTVWAENDRENVLAISPYNFLGKSSASVFYEESREHRELDRILTLLTEVHSKFYNDNSEGDFHSRDVVKVLERVRTVNPTLFEPRDIKEVKFGFKTLYETLTSCRGGDSRKRSREPVELSNCNSSAIDNKMICKDYQFFSNTETPSLHHQQDLVECHVLNHGRRESSSMLLPIHSPPIVARFVVVFR